MYEILGFFFVISQSSERNLFTFLMNIFIFDM